MGRSPRVFCCSLVLPGPWPWPSAAEGFPVDIAVYWGTELEAFLKVLFMRLVVTPTQVELQFSCYSVLTDTRSKRLGLPGLAAKAMHQASNAAVAKWRAHALAGQVRQPNFRARPVWTKAHNERYKTRAFDP